MIEIPQSYYYWAGAIVLSNIGTIGTMLILGFRATWWLSKLDSRVTHAQETANRAHKRLDKVYEN